MSLSFRGRSVKRFCSFVLTGCAVASLSAIAAAAPGVPGDGRISFGGGIAQWLDTNGNSGPMGMSDDGRYITYFSYATNITGSAHAPGNVYRFDKLVGGTELISIGMNGADGNGVFGQILHTTRMVSPDGNLILFGSTSSNLVAGDTNGVADVFVRDVGFFGMGASTTRVSLMNGSQIPATFMNGQNISTSVALGMSNNARRILFTTRYPISGSDGNGDWDVYLFNRDTNLTTLVSRNQAGVAIGASFATISETGTYVSFVTNYSLDAADTNGIADVYRRDMNGGAVRFVSVGVNNSSPNGASGSGTMTPDGRYVAFISSASNVIGNDFNGYPDVFIRDLTGNTVVRGSTKLGFAEIARPGCTWFSLTGNGRYLALACDSNEFVTGDSNGIQDIFVKDLQGAGDVTLISRIAGGAAANNVNGGPIISRDGTWITFASYADNFVTAPTPDSNDSADVYRAQRQ